MNKIFLVCSVACMAMFSFTACEEEEWNDSKVTYYATLTLEGDEVILLDKGTAYVEPGYSAEMKGEDVTSGVIVDSNLDANTSGMYTVSYKFVNEDGFAATASRIIVVADPTDPIEGLYYSNPASYRNSKGTITIYKGEFMVLIFNNGDGTYNIDDVLGGYYGQRAGYGSRYYMYGDISVAEDGTVTLIDNGVPGWGNSADAFKDGKWNATTKTFSWDVVYAGMDFYVTLNKFVNE
ncbi:MAG: DUF5012 domain-containing protein [Bacteroidales bacterium]|nr:DUF5012 domain-containing protein [Bacteroidales bacterium]